VADAYASLRRSVAQEGLLRPAPAYYVWRTAVSFLVLGVGVALSSSPLAAAFMAFGVVQVALIGHDAGHLAVFTTRRANHALGTVCWTLVAGVSFAYWLDRHNRHHASTNQTRRDPDQQWRFGPALTPFLAFVFRLEGWAYVLRRRHAAEVTLLSLSLLAWLWPVTLLGPRWLLTYVASQVLAGLYLAAVTAPNHIGMPTWQSDARGNFAERQLRSSRNVTPGRLTDFVFGGLNYQIEHHLFPSMPRPHLRRARSLVRGFCADRGLPYTESNLLAVYRAVVEELPHLSPVTLA
jgi:fatty acid desaturase